MSDILLGGGLDPLHTKIVWVNGRPYRELNQVGSGASSVVLEVEMLIPDGTELVFEPGSRVPKSVADDEWAGFFEVASSVCSYVVESRQG